VQSLCHDASGVVLQVIGATNLSNAFYKVHPRRNDRFVAPTDKLTALFPEIDFTEIAFTGHLIARLRGVDEARFDLVKQHLQRTWLRRMKTLIGQCTGPVVLLWLRGPSDDEAPAFITRDMVNTLKDLATKLVELETQTGVTDGMCFAPLDAVNAAQALSVDAHIKAAKALRKPIMQAIT